MSRRFRRVRFLGWLLAALACGSAASAYANEDIETRAFRLFNQAKELMALGEYNSAVEDLTEAWTLFSHPLIVKKRGQCHEKLGMLEEATADYQTFMKVGRLDAAGRRQLQEHLKTLEQRMDELVTVTITSLRVGLLASVGDQTPRRVPFKVQLKPGKVTLSVKDSRFEGATQTVRIRAVAHQVIDIVGVERLGQVVVIPSSGDFDDIVVFIDSRRISVSAEDRDRDEWSPQSLAVGEHRLRCDRLSVPGTPVTFRVVPDAEVRVVCQVPTSPPQSPWFWTMVATGAAGVAAGAGVLTSYALDVTHAEETHQRLISSKPLLAGLLLATGVGLGIGSIFLYDVGSPNDSKTSTVFVQPTGDGGVFLGVTGRF